nr:organic hydroperoxide resistance protein [uncultured Cohaesibacter sp.]
MSIIYSTNVTVTGGREGSAKSEDGKLDVSLSMPKELGGDNGPGTNPEQMFGAGYAACFIGALKFAAGQDKIKFPSVPVVNATVGMGQNDKGAGFAIEVDLEVDLGDMPRDEAIALVEKAHQVCPYSNATRGNIRVGLTVK